MTSIRASRLFAYAAACAALLALVAVPPTQAQQARNVTIKQVSSGRFLTAYKDAGHDFRVVTRSSFNPKTCVWVMTPQGGGIFTLRQAGTARFLDAHEIAEKDFHLVTRPRQTFDRTQLWRAVDQKQDGVHTFVQVSSGRFMDAHEYAGKDFGVVTRPPQNNATQLWQVSSYLGNIEF